MLTLRDYALSFVGTPYIWAGEHPALGYDCSGFVQEILASVGLDPPGDQTAQKLYDHFERHGQINRLTLGSLLFFGKSVRKVSHVAFAIDQRRMVEAGGGGSAVRTVQDAIKHKAMIRVRPQNNRKDLVSIIRPDYTRLGYP
jgi:cell wall-associated NlpC family hydrolase